MTTRTKAEKAEVVAEIDAKNTRSARGAQARAKLKRAALVVMERVGYHRMRIADVTVEAGVAQGLFYHYFKDLKSLTIEVLEDFSSPAVDVDAIEKDVARGDWYGRIYAHNLLVVSSYAKRPGVMRCLLQMADEDEQFSISMRESYRQQLLWLVDVMPKMFPQVNFKKHQALMVVFSLAGLGESLLREYFVNNSATLRAADLNVEELTELLTSIFYRALFLKNPPTDKLNYTENLIYMVKTD